MSDVFILNWGAVGLGEFARKWLGDVLANHRLDPLGDGIEHRLTAVASTSSLEKAQTFAASFDKVPRAYSTYEKLLEDTEVDIVYIAAPNAFHYPLALQALRAGKHVLVEKTFTINHRQAQHLQKVAREKKRLILDGLWTRYLPTTKAVRKLVLEDKLVGDIVRVSADLSHDCVYDARSRTFSPSLGGGVLYDNVIYSISWTEALLLSQTARDPEVRSYSLKAPTGVDATTSVSLVFEDLQAVGTASGSFNVESPGDAVLIEGRKGYITLDRASRPGKATLHTAESTTSLKIGSIEGIGYYFEANIAAVCIRDSLLEPADHPLEETIRILRVFDTVKAQNGIEFPKEIEQVYE